MNKILNYMKINRGNRKIIHLLIVVLVIYNCAYYVSFLDNTRGFYVNGYDLIITLLSSYMNIAYFYFIIFLLYIYNISSKKSFYKYIFLRCKNRRQWYIYNIFNILISALIFTFIIIIQTIVQGILTLSFVNRWSEYSIHIISNKRIIYLYIPKTFNYVMNLMTPLAYTIINIFFILCFFCVLGLIYLILRMIIRNEIVSFIAVFILNCINIAIYVCEIPYFVKGTFYYNTSIITAYEKNLDYSIFLNRFLYWIVIIFILILIGKIICKHVDFQFGDDY